MAVLRHHTSALSTALTIYPCQIRVHQRWQSNFLQLGRRSGGRPQWAVYPRQLPVNCETHCVSGDRTHNLPIVSPTRYQLYQNGLTRRETGYDFKWPWKQLFRWPKTTQLKQNDGHSVGPYAETSHRSCSVTRGRTSVPFITRAQPSMNRRSIWRCRSIKHSTSVTWPQYHTLPVRPFGFYYVFTFPGCIGRVVVEFIVKHGNRCHNMLRHEFLQGDGLAAWVMWVNKCTAYKRQ